MPTKDDEDLCGATAVMEAMTDRLYEAENNLELNFNRIIEERDKVFDFEKDSLTYFKDHGCLPEWYVRYKLGQRLTLGYNLIYKENGQYKENPNYSVGYKGELIAVGKFPRWTYKGEWITPNDKWDENKIKDRWALRNLVVNWPPPDKFSRRWDECDFDDSRRLHKSNPLFPDEYGKYEDYVFQNTAFDIIGAKLDHWKIDFSGGRDPEGCESYLLDLFKNYFFDKKVCIHSHKGCVYYKIFDKSYILKDNEDPTCRVLDWIECCGWKSVEIVMEILSSVHKSVFP